MKNIILLIIVTLGIINYNQTAIPVTDIPKIEMQQFNAKFTQYEGDNVRGATVKSMLQTVLANNMSEEDDSKKVSVNGDITLNKDDTQIPQGLVSIEKTYKIRCNFEVRGDNANLVTLIAVEEN